MDTENKSKMCKIWNFEYYRVYLPDQEFHI